jgi:hypothetical protein
LKDPLLKRPPGIVENPPITDRDRPGSIDEVNFDVDVVSDNDGSAANDEIVSSNIGSSTNEESVSSSLQVIKIKTNYE